MSTDQALLESIEDTGIPVLRFYAWAPATLSLGYFQTVDDRPLHPDSLDCPMVRRASGGGAIVHDREVTYSICFPSSNRWAKRNTEVYRLLHACIADVLRNWSINAVTCQDQVSPPSAKPEFLCFLRCGSGDLLLDGCKIVGSAQRRAKRAVLQHGSILLARSRFATQLPGVQEISGRQIDPREFVGLLAPAVGQCLGMRLLDSELSQLEQRLAAQIVNDRFGTSAWNLERRAVSAQDPNRYQK